MNPDDYLLIKQREKMHEILKNAVRDCLILLEPEEVQNFLCMALFELENKFNLDSILPKKIEHLKIVATYNVAGELDEDGEPS